MGAEYCQHLTYSMSKNADLIVIEGVMGLYDGPIGAQGSTADLATILNLPIILVVDASHQAQSVAALILGFSTFNQNIKIAGVILNRVKSDRHLQALKEHLHDVPILGAVRQNDSLTLPSRHLGLIQAQEIQTLDRTIECIASIVTRETFLDKIQEQAFETTNQASASSLPPLAQHIAIARDDAFSFIYPHVLTGWRNAGAELTFFSPLAGEASDPAAGAIFLPGGYPELHAGKLAASATLTGLQKTTAIVYGECGGFMVLGERLIDAQGVDHKMAGCLPVTTSFATRELHLGYRTLRPLCGPWNKPLRGHEFHYSTLVQQGSGQPLFAATDAAGNDLGSMGLRIGNVMGSYGHIIAEAPTTT